MTIHSYCKIIAMQREGLDVMVWHCYCVCERVEEQSRIQQVLDDVANHLNMGENNYSIILICRNSTV